MAKGINKHIIIGNMVRKPELATTKGGISVTTVTVAVTEKMPSGEETEFFDCVAFGNAAEFACNYLDKGRLVFVEGRGRIRKYTDREGNERKKYEIKAFRIDALGSGRGKDSNAEGERSEGGGYGGQSGGGYGKQSSGSYGASSYGTGNDNNEGSPF